MSLNGRQFCVNPEILYGYDYCNALGKSSRYLGGAIGFETNQEILRVLENRDVVEIAKVVGDSKGMRFGYIWRQAPFHKDVMTAPELPPQPSRLLVKLWGIFQLMRILPKFFPRTNLDSSPFVIEPYDFLHAFKLLCYVNYERGHPGVAKTMPIIWCREGGGDPCGTTFSKPYIESTASGNHQPATELAYSPHRLDLGHHLPASKIDNATLPGHITSGNDSDTRQMLFQFAGKLSEYFQQNLRISVKQSGNSENDGGDAPGPSLNALVDQYACKMKQNRMEGVVIQSQALDELASRCARIMDQCSRKTPMGTARAKTADAETAHAEIAHPETAHTEIGSGHTGTNNTVVKRSKAPAKRLKGCKPPTSGVSKAKTKTKTSKPLEARKALLDSAIKLELNYSELKVEPVKMEP